MVGGNLLKIFGHAKSQDTTFGIVNQKDTTDITLSGIVTQDTNPPQPTFHIMV